jgi:CARDB
MRFPRALVTLPLAGLLGVPAAAGAAPHGFAHVRVTECVNALEQAQRVAVFEGEMRAVRGSSRLLMKFTLQARNNGQEPWARVAGPKLGMWVASDPGRKGYVYVKRIDNLIAPADYRAVVRFRWVDARGHVIASARRISRACSQRDLRPDLRVMDVKARPGSSPELRHYVVGLRNAGDTAAGPFAVTLQPDGGAQLARALDGLLAHERVWIDFEAPACAPGSALAVTVDADEQVDEAFETDNTVSVTCPELAR